MPDHIIARNTVRIKGESQALSYSSRALYVTENVSDLGMIRESGPSPDGPEMFKKNCSK